jgi:thiol-disulfide isomerase/thioredoxin
VIAALAVFAVMSTTGSGGSASEAGHFTPNDQGLLQPGSEAPWFSAEGVDGTKVSLSGNGSSRGEPTLLVFSATWCPHCNNEAPLISELAEENEDLNVIMAGIDGEDNPGKVEQFVEEYGIQGEALYQPSLGQTYQVTSYPTTYIIDAEGQIVGANSGETPKGVLQGWTSEAKS